MNVDFYLIGTVGGHGKPFFPYIKILIFSLKKIFKNATISWPQAPESSL